MKRLNFPMKKQKLSSYEIKQNTKITNPASCEENYLKTLPMKTEHREIEIRKESLGENYQSEQNAVQPADC